MREDRIQQRGFSGARLPHQQHEPALVVHQRPFERSQAFAMSFAEIENRRGRYEAKWWSVESEVLVVHRVTPDRSERRQSEVQ
jgi:hypothetical protein